jgi:hypothetical protein
MTPPLFFLTTGGVQGMYSGTEAKGQRLKRPQDDEGNEDKTKKLLIASLSIFLMLCVVNRTTG